MNSICKRRYFVAGGEAVAGTFIIRCINCMSSSISAGTLAAGGDP